MYMPVQIQLKTVKMVEIEPESDVLRFGEHDHEHLDRQRGAILLPKALAAKHEDADHPPERHRVEVMARRRPSRQVEPQVAVDVPATGGDGGEHWEVGKG